MGQHLQGIERRIYTDTAVGQQALYRIGKAEEQRIARSKNHNLTIPDITLEHRFQRNGNVYPHRSLGQKPPDQLTVAHSSRKHASPGNDLLHLRRKVDFGAVAYADNMK